MQPITAKVGHDADALDCAHNQLASNCSVEFGSVHVLWTSLYKQSYLLSHAIQRLTDMLLLH